MNVSMRYTSAVGSLALYALHSLKCSHMPLSSGWKVNTVQAVSTAHESKHEVRCGTLCEARSGSPAQVLPVLSLRLQKTARENTVGKKERVGEGETSV